VLKHRLTRRKAARAGSLDYGRTRQESLGSFGASSAWSLISRRTEGKDIHTTPSELESCPTSRRSKTCWYPNGATMTKTSSSSASRSGGPCSRLIHCGRHVHSPSYRHHDHLARKPVHPSELESCPTSRRSKTCWYPNGATMTKTSSSSASTRRLVGQLSSSDGVVRPRRASKAARSGGPCSRLIHPAHPLRLNVLSFRPPRD
jgi:hypothetical protein